MFYFSTQRAAGDYCKHVITLKLKFFSKKMDQLISEVQKRTVLWNKWDPKFKDRAVVDKEWDCVSKELGISSKLYTKYTC